MRYLAVASPSVCSAADSLADAVADLVTSAAAALDDCAPAVSISDLGTPPSRW